LKKKRTDCCSGIESARYLLKKRGEMIASQGGKKENNCYSAKKEGRG